VQFRGHAKTGIVFALGLTHDHDVQQHQLLRRRSLFFEGLGRFDTGRNFSERKDYRVLATPGVRQGMQTFGR
jgi:hypothetical protein